MLIHVYEEVGNRSQAEKEREIIMVSAIELLQQVEKYNKIIENKLIEIKQWKALALSTTTVLTPDKVQTSSNPQKMADAIHRYIEIEKEINEIIDALYDAKKAVLEKIEQLDILDYNILHIIYIQMRTLDDVAVAYGRSYSWAVKHHNMAVDSLQELLSAENT